MINWKGWILAAVLLSLCVATGTAVADQSCRNVQSNLTGLSAVFAGPENCNGYEFCQSADIRGTLNGTLWAYYNSSDQDVVLSGTAFVLAADDIIETNRGDIYGTERGIVNFFTPEGYVAHIGVSGGSGNYDGAVGWLSLTILFVNEIGGEVTGEICGPNL